MHKTRSVLLSGVAVCITLTTLGVGTAIGQQSTGEQARSETRASETTYSPVADPKAVVTLGNARFTVLTSQLIRMEWAADGKFEDHASFVFLNRRLPVPRFTSTVTKSGTNQLLKIKTSDLDLSYSSSSSDDGKFTADNLNITLQLDGKPVTW